MENLIEDVGEKIKIQPRYPTGNDSGIMEAVRRHKHKLHGIGLHAGHALADGVQKSANMDLSDARSVGHGIVGHFAGLFRQAFAEALSKHNLSNAAKLTGMSMPTKKIAKINVLAKSLPRGPAGLATSVIKKVIAPSPRPESLTPIPSQEKKYKGTLSNPCTRESRVFFDLHLKFSFFARIGF